MGRKKRRINSEKMRMLNLKEEVIEDVMSRWCLAEDVAEKRKELGTFFSSFCETAQCVGHCLGRFVRGGRGVGN